MIRQKISFFVSLSVVCCVIACSVTTSLCQSTLRIINTEEVQTKGDSYLGRDVWFAIPMNYSPTDRSTKYFNVYVNSPRATTVNFQITGGPIIKKPVTAGKVAVYTSPTPLKPSPDIPLSTELYTSGVVEQKAIHVWSDDADIAVYFLSRRDFSSGGMYVLPPTGWGKEYIVGTYESIFDPSGRADWPSQFALVSDQDNTTVSITPSWDLRKQGFPSIVEHAKGVQFTVNLNRGECVQYQTVLPKNDNECDLTGTIITSNNNVGVMGSSVDPYIYFPYGYGDYCLTMLQPVRTWSNVYLTSPFAGRTYGGDAYCVIGTTGQTIYRNGIQIALLSGYGDRYYIYDDQSPSPAALWTSDAPFEMMQYIPSATYGTGVPNSAKRNLGDADMTNINPADQFGRRVYFQVPTIDVSSGQTPFTNYVNILLPTSHEGVTTYDGLPLNAAALPKNIVKRERFPVPNTGWEGMRLTYKQNTGEGSHTVISDTGVGVYLYGYGSDDSYSWAGALGTRNHNDPDTIPPVVIGESVCFCGRVRLYDTGPLQSKLSSFVSDSSFNIAYYPDPNFIAGAGRDSSYYDMCIIDSSLEAYLAVSAYDLAGNRTTVFSKYTPQFAKFSPAPLNFGTVNVGNVAYKYDTLCNTGENPFHFIAANLKLKNGS
ncbi:MAG: IgGFc-binding protein, partial [Ignavibacteriota bacterium]